MRSLIARWLGSAAGLLVASYWLAGLSVAGPGALLVGALLLGVINAIVRPVFVFLTFPITVVTLGLFLLVVNAAMLGLTALLVPGFEIRSFVSAVLGSVLVSVGTAIGDFIAGGDDD